MEPHLTPESNELDWVPLTPHLGVEKTVAYDPATLRNFGLVLAARGIPHRLQPQKKPREIFLPDRFLAIGCHEISLYLEENPRRETTRKLTPQHNNQLVSLSVLLLLGIFHNMTYLRLSGFGHFSIDWLDLGSADSGRILAGQWWRTVTALTLHADFEHLLGNLLLGGYFIARLCQLTGSGFGWLLLLVAGSLGNTINACAHGAGHNGIGASTAIFGAIGIAGAIGSTLSKRALLRNWLLPLAAATMLLAFFGGGEAPTDIGAHLLGFISGTGCGYLAGIYIDRNGMPGRTGNRLMALLAVIIVIGAWILALQA